MHDTVSKVLSIPSIIAVFSDAEKPDEFFCIAMEDMLEKHTAIDQIAGLSYVVVAHSLVGHHFCS
jgi:hypothetical protein